MQGLEKGGEQKSFYIDQKWQRGTQMRSRARPKSRTLDLYLWSRGSTTKSQPTSVLLPFIGHAAGTSDQQHDPLSYVKSNLPASLLVG